jgi:hypothetical protein
MVVQAFASIFDGFTILVGSAPKIEDVGFRSLSLDVHLNADARWTSDPAKAFFDAPPRARAGYCEPRSDWLSPVDCSNFLTRSARRSGRACSAVPYSPSADARVPLGTLSCSVFSRDARPCPGWRNTGVRSRIGSINELQFAQYFLESARQDLNVLWSVSSLCLGHRILGCRVEAARLSGRRPKCGR